MTATCFHEQFEALLPKIKESARFAFRALNPGDRDEAVADVCAAAWSAWHGLIRRGKNPLEVGPYGILTNAIRYVRNGRRVGNRGCGRGRMDLWNHRAQKGLGFRLVSLASAQQEREVKAWIANDHRSTPADHAAFLIDLQESAEPGFRNDAGCRLSCCPKDTAPRRSRAAWRHASRDKSGTDRARQKLAGVPAGSDRLKPCDACSMTTIPSRLIMRSITFHSMARPRLALPDPGARGVRAIKRIRRRSSTGRRPATTRAPAWQPFSRVGRMSPTDHSPRRHRKQSRLLRETLKSPGQLMLTDIAD